VKPHPAPHSTCAPQPQPPLARQPRRQASGMWVAGQVEHLWVCYSAVRVPSTAAPACTAQQWGRTPFCLRYLAFCRCRAWLVRVRAAAAECMHALLEASLCGHVQDSGAQTWWC